MTRGWIKALMLLALPVSGTLAGQEPGMDAAARQQIQAIARDRPPQAEAAARTFLSTIAPERGCHGGACAVLDELRARQPASYWMEIGQLTVQFDIFQQVMSRDTARARQVAVMFGTEFEARVLQRAWAGATEPQRRGMRTQLEALMTRHFEAEDALAALEVRDIRRRLADVESQSERRRTRRAELVRWAVDDIIHQAQRPD